MSRELWNLQREPSLNVSGVEVHLKIFPSQCLATCGTFKRPLLRVSRVLRYIHNTNSDILQVNQGSILLRVLTQARGSQVSDPLDKVYGNLGIVRRALGTDFDEQALPPNYAISVSDLYSRVASYILTTVPILSLLSHVEEAEERKPTLPSWVPDLSVNHPRGTTNRFGNAIDPLENDRPLYNAGLTRSNSNLFVNGYRLEPMSEIAVEHSHFYSVLPATRSMKNGILFVNGYHLGPISQVAVGYRHFYGADEFVSQLQLLSSLPATYLNGQSTFESYWRTFLGNIVPKDLEPAIPKLFVALIIYILLSKTDEDFPPKLEKTLQELADLDHNFSQHLKALDIPSLDLLSENIPVFVSRCAGAQFREGLWAALERYTLLFLQMSEYSGRALLRTDNGYLSLGPRRSRVGDQVWVVEQARVPFVLRPIPDTGYYELVGECYVHGIMNGELVGLIEFVKVGLA